MKSISGIAVVFMLGYAYASISQKGYSDTGLGLSLKIAEQNWDFYSPSQENQKEPNRDLAIKFIARGPYDKAHNTQPTLTLRTDKGRYLSAKAYAEKWLKEFPKFGYDLLNSTESTKGSLNGYDIEVSSQISNRRVKQFLVHRPNEIWVFTCTADQSNYKEVWAQCESILKTAQLK